MYIYIINIELKGIICTFSPKSLNTGWTDGNCSNHNAVNLTLRVNLISGVGAFN